jgi:hypothetical protein
MLKVKQEINSPYLFAAERKDFSKILTLYEQNKADLNAVSNDGTSAMWMAAARGYTDIVKLLGRLDADVNLSNALGYSPLMIAAHNNHLKTVFKLFDLGAQVDQVNHEGSSSVIVATKKGHVDMIRLLTQLGGDIDKPNRDGLCPLLVAIKDRRADVVKVLYSLGADVGVVTKIGFLVFKSRKVVPGTVTDGVFLTEVLREVMRRCVVCQIKSPRRLGCCRRCERVHYCSQQCQKKAHRRHKRECVKNMYFYLNVTIAKQYNF